MFLFQLSLDFGNLSMDEFDPGIAFLIQFIQDELIKDEERENVLFL